MPGLNLKPARMRTFTSISNKNKTPDRGGSFPGRKGELKMLSRKELESLGVVMTDEQWENFSRQAAEIEDKMWAEDHPLDA